ncbi:hypothetical protein [Agromyces sp. NPDC058110]|uniref:hypothetical protein n=1 Tax=Agromyces sp. NPDC058110 TaxID=3346345 RepID=UPI0036DF1C14
MSSTSPEAHPQPSARGVGMSGILIGVVGAVLALGAFGIAMVDSWRAWERCGFAAPPAGHSGSSVDSSATLFPLGYRCSWVNGDQVATVVFGNWPLTAAALAGIALLAMSAWMVARSRLPR